MTGVVQSIPHSAYRCCQAEKDMFDHLRGFLAPPSNEAGSNEAPNINEKVTLLIANIVQDASGRVCLCKDKSFA